MQVYCNTISTQQGFKFVAIWLPFWYSLYIVMERLIILYTNSKTFKANFQQKFDKYEASDWSTFSESSYKSVHIQIYAVVIIENRCLVSMILRCHKCLTATGIKQACTPCMGRRKIDLVPLYVVLTLMPPPPPFNINYCFFVLDRTEGIQML